MKGSGREVEGLARFEVGDTTPDQPQHGGNYASPEQDRDFADGGDTPIEQHDEQDYQAAGDSFGLPPIQWMQVARIARKPNGGGRYRKRRLHEGLPYEKKRHQPAPFSRAIGFAEKH